ncbi:amidohydrolase family protein [Desulfoplanes formicivorans]|uniref:Amidohydrolase n=1 Tax=Desulfoplanes formicivorans TaxID=1592317 RepID=A0A194ADR0_9BACT|nr:amidohydrolase family protein [Desulfoplanes formicivorans]GAU08212.1 amidohydrolase [Desulfoplanes formicivorans]
MKVIDFRFRPNTQATIDGFTNSTMFKGMFEKIDLSHMKAQTVPEVVEDLKKHNVVKAVITGRDCESTYDAASNNAGVVDFVQSFPEIFLGFVGLDPHKGMKAVGELQESVESLGMHGASIDPYLARIPANDARYYPLYAKCCELGVPMVISTGPATLVPNAVMEHAAPRYIDYVARDFPDLKIIISHGGYPWVNEAIIVTERNRNVYMELSEYEHHPGAEAYVQAANTIIPDKILFASAHPGVDFRQAMNLYNELPFAANVRENIMYNNAARVLGL